MKSVDKQHGWAIFPKFFMTPRLLPISSSVLAMLLFLAVGGCGHPSLDVKIPREQVVPLIVKQFPISKTVGAFTVTLSSPRIRFDGVQNRLELSGNLDFTMAGLPPGNGEVTIQAKLGVDNGEIVLTEVQVPEVSLNGIDNDNAAVMKKFVSQSLLQALDGVVVYDLGKNGTSQYVAGITVTEDGLDVRLAPAP